MAETLLDKEILTSKDLIELLGERPYGNYPVSRKDADTIGEITVDDVKIDGKNSGKAKAGTKAVKDSGNGKAKEAVEAKEAAKDTKDHGGKNDSGLTEDAVSEKTTGEISQGDESDDSVKSDQAVDSGTTK